METIYSSVVFKKNNTNEARDAEPPKAAAANEEVVYSTLAFSSPAGPSPSNLPGPVDPADPSDGARTKVMTKARSKDRLLFVSLCALLFAVALITGVLYISRKILHEEFARSLTEKLHQYNKSLWNCSMSEDTLSKVWVNMTHLERENRDLLNNNNNLTSQLSEMNRSIEQLQAEKENLTSELQTLMAKANHCAEGWKFYSGKCYYFSTYKKTWTASRDACVAEGADLVIITSIEEQDFLKSQCLGIEHYWIGLTDAVKERDWRWLDGTKLSATPWYWTGNEPDNWKGYLNMYPEGEDCAVMQLGSNTYQLQDAFCDVANKICKYVCEAKAGM
ncbi:C-type lectin domain family 12 member B-like [Electrophorus electricus]|uniref:C-type lectin domain family 12 member B-like n=1 Tax=Electrophorus electricus TaxID=8005 RepID=UPI0015CF89A4|nr:C-type lectin domain family 12 member B-like [Electrophorus electricus]